MIFVNESKLRINNYSFDDVRDWCIKQFGPSNNTLWVANAYTLKSIKSNEFGFACTFWFANNSDAVLFKLVWGEYCF